MNFLLVFCYFVQKKKKNTFVAFVETFKVLTYLKIDTVPFNIEYIESPLSFFFI